MPTVHRTACNRDCPDACSLLVTVEDGRAVALRGDPDDPLTAGFLCERTGRFLHRQHAPERITTPLLRADLLGARIGRGGGAGADLGDVRRERRAPLVPVDWDTALDVAAARLLRVRDEHGPEAILHYVSGGSLGILKATAALLFERFGPVTIKRGDICTGAGEAAQETDFGVSESHDVFDLLNSRTIVLWGKNVHVTNVHLLPVLRRARDAGARLVGIDPIRTRAAGLCELFLQPRPGGDADLALGMIRWLFDHGRIAADAAARCEGLPRFRELAHARDVAGWAAQADVSADDLRRLAALYADGPANLQVGMALTRRRHGAGTVRVLDALGALSGNLGRPGGGVSFYYGRRTAFDLDFVRGLEAAPRSLAEARLGPELLAADPPVRAVWITAGNPVAMLPDSRAVRAGLLRSDFNVVVDTHPTDTTDVADLVLPTLTLLEDDDLLGAYGHHWLRESRPAVAPPGANHGGGPGTGPRHELHILQGLAARLGLADVLAGSIDDWKQRLTRRLQAAGAGLDALRTGTRRNPFAAEVLFADGAVPRPGGRVRLPEAVPQAGHAITEGFPFLLMATSSPKGQSSQWSEPLPPGPPEARVHPAAAGALADGRRARLQSRRGELEVVVRHDPAVRPDVVLMAKGGQLRDGRCTNALIAAAETDAGGSACFYEEPVRLVAATVTAP